MPPVRVVVVDDSPTARRVVRRVLSGQPGVEVVGEAGSGAEARRAVRELRPDVVTLDVHLGREDGVDLAAVLMEEHPTPIVVLTGLEVDPRLALRVREAGALEVLPKPPAVGHPDHARAARRLVRTVTSLARVPTVTRRPPRARAPEAWPAPAVRPEVVLIGASTGGPPVLEVILRALPSPFPLPIVIVQHVAAGFGHGLARWLGAATGHCTRLAVAPERLEAGRVLVAPDDDRHLRVTSRDEVAPGPGPPRGFQRPSVDELFESAARWFGAAALAVQLTGMGRDGVEGLGALRQAGAHVLAQAPGTCAVASMPERAIEAGLASQVLTPPEIAEALRRLA